MLVCKKRLTPRESFHQASTVDIILVAKIDK